MPQKRTEIPGNIADRLLADNRHTCCICRIRKDVVIHHIDSNSSNNNPENLCVLCAGCHSDVHSNQGLGRKFTPGEIKIYKEGWEDRCKLEDTKKNIIKNTFIFVEKFPKLKDTDFLKQFVIDVSSGSTSADIATSVEASTNFIEESLGSRATAKQFKKFVLNQCDNFLIPGKCDEWIIDRFELKDFEGKIDYLTTLDYEKADQICSKCPNFKPKK